jgi:hypothetical protein
MATGSSANSDAAATMARGSRPVQEVRGSTAGLPYSRGIVGAYPPDGAPPSGRQPAHPLCPGCLGDVMEAFAVSTAVNRLGPAHLSSGSAISGAPLPAREHP